MKFFKRIGSLLLKNIFAPLGTFNNGMTSFGNDKFPGAFSLLKLGMVVKLFLFTITLSSDNLIIISPFLELITSDLCPPFTMVFKIIRKKIDLVMVFR